MKISELIDKLDPEENLYAIVVDLAQKARELQTKSKPSEGKNVNPVIAVLEEELAKRTEKK
ncbi:MAG: hypothetical protein COZ37_06820 [bacterium (Candidatus Ratteibacteria) CG_4_10_14_3_um_filter_41_18]|uniref:DNA-directed RNA polymerase subunit omega n=4 Tax=Candidatus Ratteibacteria TaxID=2979319 RepID=A0A2M7EA43_9BACT|nr:MAG: hypothetical protein AUJ76_01920 [Candidatus Omnitrophica bacterium CG1_02_41_171]PIV64607.1 MAG: hypothetical protein COS11_01290 [bacterium (Candidatus Ratteibacteria) CG01_land_8_20_14_3_00_40_19]PIW33774.1 MAG: hypothetical protein COW28_02795 [bacterium (Candidatus Ratteibacteria) CG15_BIG_FIL_POST_REV_8_21_14_020_41_12]PIW74027.1 MAG: hypothetical protein CO004_02860 [bacterium (Candidatus Ratteibacteria) CG_4_8_14_3_um_filter_41_36]PIX76641.1 MAG: hypothetical protein COZ37_06820